MARFNPPETDPQAEADLAIHEADTTNVHGIPDTSTLATDADVDALRNASGIGYSPTTSGLAADDVQAAIDEVVGDLVLPDGLSLEVVNGKLQIKDVDSATSGQVMTADGNDGATFATPVSPLHASIIALRRPANCVSETVPGRFQVNSSQGLTSGTLYVSPLVAQAGVSIASLGFLGTPSVSSTTFTHQWAALLDSSLRVRAVSADGTSGSWPNPEKVFTLSYTPGATDEFLYAAFCETHTAGTPTLVGGGVGATAGALSPILAATSSTGLTTPPTVGTTMGALTAIAVAPYVRAYSS